MLGVIITLVSMDPVYKLMSNVVCQRLDSNVFINGCKGDYDHIRWKFGSLVMDALRDTYFSRPRFTPQRGSYNRLVSFVIKLLRTIVTDRNGADDFSVRCVSQEQACSI